MVEQRFEDRVNGFIAGVALTYVAGARLPWMILGTGLLYIKIQDKWTSGQKLEVFAAFAAVAAIVWLWG